MSEPTFTDFMIRGMEGEDSVAGALLIVRRTDGSIGYRCFNQEFADTIGLLRFTTLSVERDLIQSWDE